MVSIYQIERNRLIVDAILSSSAQKEREISVKKSINRKGKKRQFCRNGKSELQIALLLQTQAEK